MPSLTHLRLQLEDSALGGGAKGQRKKIAAATMSTSEAQNELRRLVWRDLG